MTAEEQAAVEWLEGLTEGEMLYHFRMPAGESIGMFSVKEDHEVSRSGRCYQCTPGRGPHELVVIE